MSESDHNPVRPPSHGRGRSRGLKWLTNGVLAASALGMAGGVVAWAVESHHDNPDVAAVGAYQGNHDGHGIVYHNVPDAITSHAQLEADESIVAHATAIEDADLGIIIGSGSVLFATAMAISAIERPPQHPITPTE